MSPNRTRALLLVVLMLASSAALLPPPADAQDDDVPTEFASAGLNQASLHLWREGGSNGDTNDCQPNVAEDDGGTIPSPDTGDNGFCAARLNPLPGSQGLTPSPDNEQRPLGGTGFDTVGDGNTNDSASIRFAMDTDGPGGARGQGAEFGFTIPARSHAIQYQFYYDTQQDCTMQDGEPTNPIEFTMRLRRASEGSTDQGPGANDPAPGTILPSTQARTLACGGDGTQSLSRTEASLVTASVSLNQPITINKDQTLIVEVYAYDPTPPGAGSEDYAIYFEDVNYPSKVTLQTQGGVVQKAVWATDNTGTIRDTFDPNAPEDERFMVGRMALKSPFGAVAVPSTGFTGQIRDPNGAAVDLFPTIENDQLSVDFVELQQRSSNHGAKKIYRFEQRDNTQPWQYPEGVDPGPYTIEASGQVLDGRTLDFGETVAMGAFDFSLDPITEETTLHNIRPGTSTTFLLRLSNDGPTADVYEFSTEFTSTEGGGTWGSDLVGPDQNGRVSLQPGESVLVRATLTPPQDASSGDAARLKVSAESQASDSVKSLTVQGTITQQTTRDVRVLVFRDDPYTVGVDRTTEIRIFAWNKGTAVDGITANFIEGSFDPADTTQFTARLPQKTFSNIAPGSVVSVPIQVTTTENVSRQQELNFSVRFSSVNVPEETDQGAVNAIVEAERAFDVFALDGTNLKALETNRFGRYNITEEAGGGGGGGGLPGGDDGGGGNAPECESTGGSNFHARNCRDYTNRTYHRFVIHNRGDLTETFDLSIVGEQNSSAQFDAQPVDGSTSCTAILQDLRFKNATTGFVETINLDADPSSEDLIDAIEVDRGAKKTVYLRVVYDGHEPLYNDVGAGNACLWESYEPTVEFGLQDSVQSTFLDTSTRVYSVHPKNSEMEDGARARLALDDRYADNGTFIDLPRFTPVQPGTNETIPFTLSLQSGHYDPANLTLEPRNIVEDLREDGWTLDLVPLSATAVNRTEGGILFPASKSLTARTPGEERFHHVSGGDYTVGLRVGPPAEGVQENVRHTFTVSAASSQDAGVRDTLGLGVQVGQDFGFKLDEGRTEVNATQGGTAAFALKIENTGASRDTFNIDATVRGLQVEPTIRRSSLEISPGSSKTVSIAVDVPQSAQTGTPATISAEVTAKHGTPAPGDDETVTAQDYILNVRSSGTLSISGPSDDAPIGPGGQNALNFTVTNDQNVQRTVRIEEVVAPEGFSTTLSSGSTTFEIEAQSSHTFTYLVEAPDDIVKGSVFPFMLRVADANDQSDFATGAGFMTVIGQTAVDLTAEEERLVVDRGGNVTFPILIENPGTEPAFYETRTQFSSAGWTWRVLDDGGQPFGNDPVRVPEKTFKRVLLDVQAPDDVSRGHVEQLTFTATAQGNASVSDSVDLAAPIHDYAVSIQIDGAQAKDAVPGDDMAYTVSITNEGNGEDTISLSFEGLESEEPVWPATSELSDGTTPPLEPGETLEDVTIEVQVPGPDAGPVPTPEGVETVIRATSSGELPDGGSPTATTQVTTRLVKYQPVDVDGDGALEMAVDLNRDASDGYETFADRDSTLIERGELASDAATPSEGLYTVDADDDGRIEHIVDTNRDGLGEVYFDPDRAQTFQIPYTVDATGDGQPEHPLDGNFDGFVEQLYNPSKDTAHKTVQEDFSGDGRLDLLTDTNDDTAYDTFVDPHATPPIVTPVEQDGDIYKLDTDDNGEIDTHYNVQSGEIADARAANLGDFVANYWWFLVIFVVVVSLFGVIVYRRL